MNKYKLISVLNKHWDIYEICKRLQQLSKEKTNQEISTIIEEIRLPLNIHLFITSNYSDLMTLIYK